MFFGLTIEKLLLIGVIAALLIGPERLPAAAESLRRAIVHVRGLARVAQDRVREELGPEMTELDWQRLDPRRYDPRRIVREALLAEPEAAPVVAPLSAPDAPADAPEPGADQAEAATGSGPGTPPEALADTVRSADSTRRTAA